MTATALALATLLGQDGSANLHPAFIKDGPTLQAAWDKGLADAPKKRDALGVLSKFRKGIGDIRITAFKHQTVSWLWLTTPEVLAYYTAFVAAVVLEGGTAGLATPLVAAGLILLFPKRREEETTY